MKKNLFLTLISIVLFTSCAMENKDQNLNREWMMTTFMSYKKDFLTKKKAGINLVKNENGNYNAYMGCNNMFFSADFKDNGTVKFSEVASTRKLCNDNQKLEDNFVTTLPKMTNYKIEGHNLTLSNKKGQKMVFVAADWD